MNFNIFIAALSMGSQGMAIFYCFKLARLTHTTHFAVFLVGLMLMLFRRFTAVMIAIKTSDVSHEWLEVLDRGWIPLSISICLSLGFLLHLKALEQVSNGK